MKAEDIRRIWDSSYTDKEHESLKDQVIRFARACEQHGIARAEAGARVGTLTAGDPNAWVDWSALDAEIAKENEDG